jgi:hypothetical protein
MKATYQWASQGLVIQSVLFNCSLSVVNDLQMQQWFQENLTTNRSHITSKGDDYFKQLLETQNKQNKAFVSKVTVNEKAQEASYLQQNLLLRKGKKVTKLVRT